MDITRDSCTSLTSRRHVWECISEYCRNESMCGFLMSCLHCVTLGGFSDCCTHKAVSIHLDLENKQHCTEVYLVAFLMQTCAGTQGQVKYMRVFSGCGCAVSSLLDSNPYRQYLFTENYLAWTSPGVCPLFEIVQHYVLATIQVKILGAISQRQQARHFKLAILT